MYGYQDLGEKLFVSLGWGTDFADKWIVNANFENVGYTYRIAEEEEKHPPMFKVK